jgi:hypothetical protein
LTIVGHLGDTVTTRVEIVELIEQSDRCDSAITLCHQSSAMNFSSGGEAIGSPPKSKMIPLHFAPASVVAPLASEDAALEAKERVYWRTDYAKGAGAWPIRRQAFGNYRIIPPTNLQNHRPRTAHASRRGGEHPTIPRETLVQIDLFPIRN